MHCYQPKKTEHAVFMYATFVTFFFSKKNATSVILIQRNKTKLLILGEKKLNF
uniref:Uncharacterized protein n=1 Tax=Arundo donax TaxID=35708 RepID=A0A0A9B496_ARUDO